MPHASDPPRRLQPVHYGHMNVHQHNVIGIRSNSADRRRTIACEVGLATHSLQQSHHHDLVYFVVLGNQYLQPSEIPDLGDFGTGSAAAAIPAEKVNSNVVPSPDPAHPRGSLRPLFPPDVWRLRAPGPCLHNTGSSKRRPG